MPAVAVIPVLVQHLPHHGHGKLVGAHVVIGQIARHINENLVDGVGVDIRRGHIFEVGLVDLGGNIQIPLHPGRRNNVAQPQCRVCVQGIGIKRGAGKVVFAIFSHAPPFSAGWQFAAAER